MSDYRINEVKYDDGVVLFFAQYKYNGWFKEKWKNIGTPGGHYKIETANLEIDSHKSYHNPPKIVESKFHLID